MYFKCGITLLLLVFYVFKVEANERSARIIYGKDNRLETYNASNEQQAVAASTAAMLSKMNLIAVDSENIMINPATFENSYGLCPGERFSQQPVAADCSGFLVLPDVLVTAAHCVSEKEVCDETVWLFDYKLQKKSKKADIIYPKKNFFECEEIIDTKYMGVGSNSQDYSVIKLKRHVRNRKPLEYRTEGKIANSSSVYVVGHPTGLPQKVTTGGKVFENSSVNFFETNLDTFGGSSGAGVFNTKTNIIEGILVRGAKDFISDSCGLISNRVNEDLNMPSSDPLGEEVSRITDITILKNRAIMFNMAMNGSVEKLKKLLLKNSYLLITDKKANTLLHTAVRYQKFNMVKYLIELGINYDAQNLKQETALHLAAYVGNSQIVEYLIRNGASVGIRDQYNKLPSGRTPYLSFRLRKRLKNLEQQHIFTKKD